SSSTLFVLVSSPHSPTLLPYTTLFRSIAGYRALAYKTISNFQSEAEFIIHAHHYVDDNQLSVAQRFLHYLNQMINQTVSAKYVGDRKSTHLNSSHVSISYAVFFLKKKN